MTARQILLPKPHSEKQKNLIEHPGNVVAFCGRRWGKTDALIQRVFLSMTARPGLYWWVGLSWRSASMKRAWRKMHEIAHQILRQAGMDERKHINIASREIRIPGLGEIWFRTAANPSSLAGEGIQGVVLDEFSLMQEAVWTEYVQATLLDYGGWAAFSGVPKGENWAAQLWRSAAGLEGWLQIHATTYENPHIKTTEIERIRGTVSERIFAQEYLAQIVENSGQVFRNVTKLAIAQEQEEAVPGHRYVFGVDWGRHRDFTVICVVDLDERAVVQLERFTSVEYVYQLAKLRLLAQKFKPDAIVIEVNAAGEPLFESLNREGLPVQPFRTSAVSKQAIIDTLVLAFESESIHIIPDPVLIAELQEFECVQLPSGMLRYGAPAGMHDDTVMALALAWSVAEENTQPLVLFAV